MLRFFALARVPMPLIGPFCRWRLVSANFSLPSAGDGFWAGAANAAKVRAAPVATRRMLGSAPPEILLQPAMDCRRAGDEETHAGGQEPRSLFGFSLPRRERHTRPSTIGPSVKP